MQLMIILLHICSQALPWQDCSSPGVIAAGTWCKLYFDAVDSNPQALSMFSAALASGQLGPLMSQFGLPAEAVDAANKGGECWCWWEQREGVVGGVGTAHNHWMWGARISFSLTLPLWESWVCKVTLAVMVQGKGRWDRCSQQTEWGVMCNERSWGSAELCWLCFLARNAKDSGGVTVTLKGMPFLWESNSSSEISEHTQGQLWGIPFPQWAFSIPPITARILVLGCPGTIKVHKMLCQRDLDVCYYCLKFSSLLIHAKATVWFLSNETLTLCGQQVPAQEMQ